MHTPWMVPLPELAVFSSPSSHAVTMPPSSMLGQRAWCPTSHMHCTSWPKPISVSKTDFHRPWLWTSFLLSISAASWASPSRTHHHPNPEQKEESRVTFVTLRHVSRSKCSFYADEPAAVSSRHPAFALIAVMMVEGKEVRQVCRDRSNSLEKQNSPSSTFKEQGQSQPHILVGPSLSTL